MATAPPSSLFTSLTGVWSLLALRSDVDDIIIELLGRFDLEKIYADSNKDVYADLILALLAQLDVIFFIQRLTLPAPGRSPAGWSLGFLVSWEVAVRTVEFVLQTVLEAREVLWDASFRDEYLARLLLSTVRILLLHPKPPANSKARDRRDRFARIQRSLERICDSYPDTNSSPLAVCRAIADTLCSAPDALTLPPRLKQELPSLSEDLYPLPDCLSSSSVATIVPQSGSTWLSQLLALYDVSQFVVGANIQFAVNNRKSGDAELEAASKKTRDAVLHAINRLRSPPHLPPGKLVPVISESFRIILSDTPSLVQHGSNRHDHDGNITDAWDMLHDKLSYRQMVHRISDRAVMHSVYQITRYIELLDDPSDQLKSTSPGLYVVNCQQCHLIGYSQVKNIGQIKPLTDDTGKGQEITLPRESMCTLCGSKVTMLREVPLARYTWENLKSIIPNVEAINVERHLPTQFLLSPPRADQLRRDSGGTPGGLSSVAPFNPLQRRWNGVRTDSVENLPSLGNRKMSDTPPPRTPRAITGEHPFSADDVGEQFSRTTSIEQSTKGVTFTSQSWSSSSGARTLSPPGRSEKSSSKWKSRFNMTRKDTKDSADTRDTSSLSSATLESQKLEEIDLRNLVNRAKESTKGKFAQNINVSLSQDSTYTLFWTHSSIQIWDVSTSPPSFKDSVSTEGFCVLAAVTGKHLAYMIGDRDQRLTLRIKILSQMSSTAVEYRMRPSPWCRCMAVTPTGGFVAVGFENATVGLYNCFDSQSPRQYRLHARHHQNCKDCPPVDTVSFSNDGLVLVASTRSTKNGTIQVYLSRFPFSEFEEILPCRYRVPLHESEDNGVSSVHFQPGTDGRDDLVCVTTWTQSGVPVLIQPNGGHKTEIRSQSSSSNRQGKLGHRIQASAFAPSGRELALVNDQGYVYRVSDLSSVPMDIRRVATSKAIPMKSDSFALAFVPLLDEETIVLSWSDSSKAKGYVRKIPIVPTGEICYSPKSNFVDVHINPLPTQSELPEREFKEPVKSHIFQKPPVELEASEIGAGAIKRNSKTGIFGSLYSKK